MDKLLKKSQKKSKSKSSKSSSKQSPDAASEKKKKAEEKHTKGQKQIRAGQIQLVRNVDDSAASEQGNGIAEPYRSAELDPKVKVKGESPGKVSAASNSTNDFVSTDPSSGASSEGPAGAKQEETKVQELTSRFADRDSVDHKINTSITNSVSAVNGVNTSETSQLHEGSTSEFNRRHTIDAGRFPQEPHDFQVQVRGRQGIRQLSVDDTVIMQDQQSEESEFKRGSKYRSSLPVVRPVINMSKARPLGLIYLQYLNQTRRAWMPNEITGIDTVRALFVRAFPKHLSMYILSQPDKKIYIRDPLTEIFYELEDIRDIKDRCVVRMVSERGASTRSQPSAVSPRPVTSYYSEPEYDGSTNMRQHRHTFVTTTAVKQEQSPAPSQTQMHRQNSSPVYTYEKRESVDQSRLHQPRPSSAMVTATLPTKTPQLFTDSVDSVTMTMKSATLPGGGRVIGTDRTEEPLQRQQVFSPVRQVALSPIKPKTTPFQVPFSSSQRPLSAPAPQRSSTPQKIEYTTAHGITPTNPEYLLRSMPHLNSGSMSDSEMIHVHQHSLSGRSTPAMSDSDTGFRMSIMEKQIANLADLVHTALVKQPRRPSVDNSSCSSQEDLVNLSEEILRTTKRNSVALSESSRSTRSGVVSESTVKDESSTTPQAYSPVRNVEIIYTAQNMKKTCRYLREDLKQIRRLHLQQTQQSRDMLREAFQSLQFVLQSNPELNQHPVRAHRSKLHQEFLQYVHQNENIETNLRGLEVKVEEMRDNVINRHYQIDAHSVESLAQLLGHVSKMLAEQKVSFPILHDNMKKVMDGEMEVVVQEERFIKEEPIRLDSSLKRCKKLTGTLFTLKRLSSVQEYHSPTHLASPSEQKNLTPTKQPEQEKPTLATPRVLQYHTSATSAFEKRPKLNHGAVVESNQSGVNNHSPYVLSNKTSNRPLWIQSLQVADESRQGIRHFTTPQELQKFEKSLQLGQAQLHQTNNAEKVNKRHREHLYNMYKQEGHHTMIQAKSSKVPPPPPPRKKVYSLKSYSPSVQSSGTSSSVSRTVAERVVAQPTSPSTKTVIASAGEGMRGVNQQNALAKKLETQPTSVTTGFPHGGSTTSKITTTVIGPVIERGESDPLINVKSSTKTMIGPSRATITVIKSQPTQHIISSNTATQHQLKQEQPMQKEKIQQQTIRKTTVTQEMVENTNDGTKSASSSAITTSPPPKPPRLSSTSSDTNNATMREHKKLPPPVPQRNSSIISSEQSIQHSYEVPAYSSSDSPAQGLHGVSQQKIKTYTVKQQSLPSKGETMLVSQKRQSKELEELSAAIAELETVTQQKQEEAQRIEGEIQKAQQSPGDDSKEIKTIRLIKYQV